MPSYVRDFGVDYILWLQTCFYYVNPEMLELAGGAILVANLSSYQREIIADLSMLG